MPSTPGFVRCTACGTMTGDRCLCGDCIRLIRSDKWCGPLRRRLLLADAVRQLRIVRYALLASLKLPLFA